MAKEGHEVFNVELPVNDPEKMREFQKAMDSYHDEMVKYFAEVAVELGITESQAADIAYLRGRSRWSEDLEVRCVKAFKVGHWLPILSGEEEEELTKLGF